MPPPSPPAAGSTSNTRSTPRPSPPLPPPNPPATPPAHPALPPAHPLPQPPFGISEDVFEAGATLYAKSCSSCHGTPAHDAAMNAKSLQLWKKHPASPAVGVSSLPPGEIFNKIKFGAPATGMPAYQHLYTDLQVWQLALLLHNADQPLPDPVTQRLNR